MSSSSKQAPQLKPRPNLAGDMNRLAALQSWSEQPVAGAVAAIGAPVEEGRAVAAEIEVEPEQHETLTGPAKPAVKTKTKDVKPTPTPESPGEGYPWEGISGNKQYSLLLPEDLLIKMTWLARTTYGDNTKQFCIRAIREKVETELKKRGIKA